MDLRLHPDGWIYLGDAAYTLAEVQAVVPTFAIPPNVVSGHYRPGQFLRVYDGQDTRGLPIPWAIGDTVLAAAATIQTTTTASRQAAANAVIAAKIAAEASRVAALPAIARAAHYANARQDRLLMAVAIEVSRTRRGLNVPPAIRSYLDTTVDEIMAILTS